MKKFTLLLTVLCLLALPALAEGEGGGDQVLQTTWINALNYTHAVRLLPISMMAYVSNGIFYDEIDIMLRSPAELAYYDGYSVFTAYQNYDYQHWAGGLTRVNPFTTTIVADGFNISDYLCGLAMPLPGLGFRTGLIGGFTVQETALLNGPVAGTAEKTYMDGGSTVNDADLDGSANYSHAYTEEYTDYINDDTILAGIGMDLGFMGVSLLADLNTVSRHLGGVANYTFTPGDDAVPNDLITSADVFIGTGENGATRIYPSSTTSWGTSIRGELPLTIIGISMPVTAALNLGGSSGGVTAAYDPPVTVNYTTSNVTGASAGTDSTSTMNYTIGSAAISGVWNPTNEVGVNLLDITDINNQAAMRADAAGAEGVLALDPDETNMNTFSVGLEGTIDPRINVNQNVVLRTRGFLGYEMEIDNNTEAGINTINYSEANATSDANSTYTYTETEITPSSTTTNTIDAEIGGILQLSDNNFITVGMGFFYHPTFELAGNNYGPEVNTVSTTWEDQTNTDPVADNTATSAFAIGPAGFQGSGTTTTTTTFTESGYENTYTHNFYIPVSVKLDLVKEKLNLVGGYILNHGITTTTSMEAKSTSETVNTVYSSFNHSGDPVYEDPDPGIGAVTETPATNKEVTSSLGYWYGTMNWLLRWMPVEAMTIDIFGETVMDALDFDIFGGGTGAGNDGLNPNLFIDSLGISISFNF